MKSTPQPSNHSGLSIRQQHIDKYLDGASLTIVITEFFVLITEVVISLLTKFGYLKYEINVKLTSYSLDIYFAQKLLHQVLAWFSIVIFVFLYGRLKFQHRKLLVIIESYILICILIFGSWNINYLGFIFAAPIIIATPLGKKYHSVVLSISIVLSILYSVLQTKLNQDTYNLVIGIATLTAIISCFFLCKRIYKSLSNAIEDLKNYASISNTLYNEVVHDYLTNAFSVAALHRDLDKDNNFKSIAFLDLDNFKYINDKKGHDTGDKILKLLVSNIQESGEFVYRYGGDEFVILSELNANELKDKIEEIKTNFTADAKELYSYPATISVGIQNINKDSKEKLFELLRDCDVLMYKSKKNGKNKITVNEK